jgi:DNA-binding LytR/AlgR family response regulator
MIRALIVEDEDLAAKRLEQLLKDIPVDLTIIGRTISIDETVTFLQKHEVDLMFLDINLSDGYSFGIFEKSQFKTPPIIFTTAYSQYAIRAFELNSISYLLKPIKAEALSLAIEKYQHLVAKKSTTEIKSDYQKLIEDFFKPYKERFLIKFNNKLETILVSDISYFYSEDKLTFAMLKSGRSLPIDLSLKQLEQELNPRDFYRINRKYMLSHNSIQEMYYTSKSRIKVDLIPNNKNEQDMVFVAIEKIGQFKKWLAK